MVGAYTRRWRGKTHKNTATGFPRLKRRGGEFSNRRWKIRTVPPLFFLPAAKPSGHINVRVVLVVVVVVRLVWGVNYCHMSHIHTFLRDGILRLSLPHPNFGSINSLWGGIPVLSGLHPNFGSGNSLWCRLSWFNHTSFSTLVSLVFFILSMPQVLEQSLFLFNAGVFPARLRRGQNEGRQEE